ncbi:apolipoprotein N-acyltransferase [Oscillatoria salina]|uniref:apolipoprotein N-acyltransferase n=1 Tax=Oscillatoria salina TaxID=331517 RepID=UPI001CCCB134|nr:apolipoprotein N-acyltransferase [Oscillatoria salina]
MLSLLKSFLTYRIFFALIGGIIMGLTPAPFNAWFLAWIGLIPLWILVVNSVEKKNAYRQAIFYAIAWGFGYHGMALFWITGVHPMTWMGVPWLASLAIALFCWLFITFWGIGIVVTWSLIITYFYRNFKFFQLVWLRILIGVALWSTIEALWAKTPLYWSSIAYTQSPYNLAILQLSQISGPLTVTAAIVAVNGLIAEFIRAKKKKQLLWTGIGLLLTWHLIGLAMYIRPIAKPSEAAMQVGIIQGNIPNEIKLYAAGWRKAIEGYTSGYQILADRGVEAILTPETALPFVWDEQRREISSLYQAILNKGVLAWVGGFDREGTRITNSLFTITGTGKTFSRYDKVKLVPLGEYIPFEKVLGRIINRLSPLDARLVTGKPNQIFETPFGRATVGICYESAFPEHFRRQTANGGEFILTSSNNAHYSETMPAQHHAQDVMRAIESDRWAVRATNTGYSGIVDPHGRTLWLSGINTYELHADTIYRRQTQTLYVRWGNWLTWFLLGLGGVLGVIFNRR